MKAPRTPVVTPERKRNELWVSRVSQNRGQYPPMACQNPTIQTMARARAVSAHAMRRFKFSGPFIPQVLFVVQ